MYSLDDDKHHTSKRDITRCQHITPVNTTSFSRSEVRFSQPNSTMRPNSRLLLALALYGATLTLAAPKYGPIGAAYFMSNTPNGKNYIVASGLTPNGGLDETFASTTATGGVGGSGVVAGESSPHPNALFTQDSVRVAGSVGIDLPEDSVEAGCCPPAVTVPFRRQCRVQHALDVHP